MAQESSVEVIFHQAASGRPGFAISLSYVVGNASPVVLTAGPTTKGGSVAVAPDARWHIGSISKSFTSTLVMLLVDRGVLTLDGPIKTYLPAYSEGMHPDWRALTLRNLLSHTAGLPANASRAIRRETYADDPYSGRRAVLSKMWSEPLDTEIGTYAYSNIGYVFAGLVVEEVMGSSWEKLIQSEIAEPLGLGSLGFGAPQETDAPRGHRSILGFKRPIEPNNLASDNPSWMGPAGAIHLNMADLATWGQVHMRACDGRLPDFLSQASCQAMQSPVSENYGLGWVIEPSDDVGPIIWHNGSNTMWYAMLYLIPDKDIAVAVATNVYQREPIEKLIDELGPALWGRQP